MWIASGYLVLILAVFLNCIGLISSVLLTLDDLFPGHSDILPRVETFVYRGQFSNLETYDGKHMDISLSEDLLKRSYLIFGFYRDGLIENPGHLFGLENVSIAFDTNINEWLSLTPELARKLGAGRQYALVVARDEAADRHRSWIPTHVAAHNRACEQANNRADIVEHEQVRLLEANRTSYSESTKLIKKEYSDAYDRAFTLFLHVRGELNIHMGRGRFH